MKHIRLLLPALLLTACSYLPFGLGAPKMQPVSAIDLRPAANPHGGVAPPPGAITVQALDTTTAGEKAAALAAAPAASSRDLGKTIATLGLATEPGFWLRSGLVTAPGKGHVKTAAGVSVAVDLLPGAGAAQLSLAAFRALGLPLAGLAEVQVYAE